MGRKSQRGNARRAHTRRALQFRSKGTCKKSGKVRYMSRVEAEMARANIEAADSSRRLKQEKRAYRCQFCRNWHLTSWQNYR